MALISSSTLVYAYAGALLTIAYFLLTAPLRLLTTAVFVILGEAMHIREASFQPSRARLEKGLPALSAQSTQLLAIIGVVLAGYAFVQLVFAAGLAVPDSLVLVKRAAGSKKHQQQQQQVVVTAPPPTTASGKNRGEEMYALITAQAQFLNIALVQVAVSGGLCAWIYVLHSGRSETFFSSSSASSSSSSLLLLNGGGGSFSTVGDVLGNQVVFSTALVNMLFWGYLWTVIRDERREVVQRAQQIKAQEEEEDEEDEDVEEVERK